MKNIESPSGPSMYKTPISYAFGQQNLKNAFSLSLKGKYQLRIKQQLKK